MPPRSFQAVAALVATLALTSCAGDTAAIPLASASQAEPSRTPTPASSATASPTAIVSPTPRPSPGPTFAKLPLGVPAGQPLGGPLCDPKYLDPPQSGPAYVAQVAAETAAYRRLEADVRQALVGKTAAQAREALKDINTANDGCLIMVDVGGGAAPALVVFDARKYGPGVVAILDGTAWQVRAFLLPSGSSGGESFLWRQLRVVKDAAGFQLLATTFATPVCRSGCGGAGPGFNTGWIAAYRFADPPALLWRSPGGAGYGSAVLSNDLVLEATVADPDPDPVQSTTVPLPDVVLSLRQILWERRGTEFVIRAQRLYPSPARTANVFVGALQKRDRAAALRVAADPKLYDSWTGTAADIEPVESPEEAARVEAAEASYWDAVPANVRGSIPATTRLAYKVGKYRLVLTRVSGEWKVTAFEPN